MSASLRYTTADLECLPDIEGVRYEIIDGELFVSRATHWHRQYASTRVLLALQLWSDQTGPAWRCKRRASSSRRTRTSPRISYG
jgi:Uma2 family endonuclease